MEVVDRVHKLNHRNRDLQPLPTIRGSSHQIAQGNRRKKRRRGQVHVRETKAQRLSSRGEALVIRQAVSHQIPPTNSIRVKVPNQLVLWVEITHLMLSMILPLLAQATEAAMMKLLAWCSLIRSLRRRLQTLQGSLNATVRPRLPTMLASFVQITMSSGFWSLNCASKPWIRQARRVLPHPLPRQLLQSRALAVASSTTEQVTPLYEMMVIANDSLMHWLPQSYDLWTYEGWDRLRAIIVLVVATEPGLNYSKKSRFGELQRVENEQKTLFEKVE